MAAKYKIRIKTALDKFELAAADALLEELAAAEEAGHEFTLQERRLWDRLITCVVQFRRTLTSIDS